MTTRALRPVEAGAPLDELAAALADALAGGPPVAPLPDEPGERDLALATLAPDQPVAEEPGAAVVLLTSGTTAQPRGVVLSAAAITASVTATHARLGGPGDWLLALPTHYVAGLMVVARASLAGTRLVGVARDLSDLSALPAPDGRRRYLSLVPTQLVRALGDPSRVRALAGLDAVLVGGAAADPGTLDRARSLGVPVVTTYGMSETCGGVVYDGVPLDKVTVDVEPDDRIVLGGPTLFSGYRLRPDLTRATLRDGRLVTADRGAWRDGRLSVLGRVDDVIVTGGRKVDLAAVERLARGWADDLAVVAVPDPEWGSTVLAVTSAAGSEAELRRHLAGRLPAYALPRRLVRLPELPRTGSGKVDRQRLVADLSEALPGGANR